MMRLSRREFVVGVGGLIFVRSSCGGVSPLLPNEITRETLWDNLDGKSISWFHPRCCMVPVPEGGKRAVMTLQAISGSDYFGPVHWTYSDNLGRNWSEPEPIPSLGRRPVEGHPGLQQGVCDVVPEYHPATKTVLALGHVVFYRGEKFSKQDQLSRYPVYAVQRADGSWSESRKLEWDDPRGSTICTNNCGQRVPLPDGDILMSFTYGSGDKPRLVSGVRCAFDGEVLTIKEVGPPLENPVGRGLLEPSLTTFGGRYFLTIRAEDDRGYVAVSDDGLQYSAKQPWTWDDGTPLTMSTTQQHWLTHSDGLYLVYTRKDPANLKVIRWRAPLYMAQVDPERLVLQRDTERIVHPLQGDGVNAPDQVAMMGNFHVTNATPEESWVTVGSWLPKQQARGQTLL
ncbi:MAG: exo-alpha-sialidase, partial [Planctomycetaceae bacterium]|nr:exo-alpha-sialidase [Planctomycetaceae bacterium]